MVEMNEKKIEGSISENNEIVWGKEKAIRLIGFNKLEPAELSIAKKIAGHYIQKIENRVKDYDEIKVNLKVHERNNLLIHEINAEIFSGGHIFNTKSENKNLFTALSECFEGMLKEIEKEYNKAKK